MPKLDQKKKSLFLRARPWNLQCLLYIAAENSFTEHFTMFSLS